MQSDNEIVELKSHNSRLTLSIFSDDYKKAILCVKEKFEKEKLLRNMTINEIRAPFLDIIEVQRIKDFIIRDLKLKYEEKEENKVNKKQRKQDTKKQVETSSNSHVDSNKQIEYPTKIIKHHLRSGALVSYDGNIIVIGDVNAGAELIASGNIIIIGVLRGFASAGAKGDKSTFVMANRIHATQLRIADLIAIPPKDENKDYCGTQMALINKNQIEIQQMN